MRKVINTSYLRSATADFVNIHETKTVEKRSPDIAVYCTDINGLVNDIKTQQNIGNVHIKFGIDAGGEL